MCKTSVHWYGVFPFILRLQEKQSRPYVLFPQPCPPAPPGGSWGSLMLVGMYNLSGVLWVCPGVSSQSNVPRIAPQGGILIRCLNSLMRFLVPQLPRSPVHASALLCHFYHVSFCTHRLFKSWQVKTQRRKETEKEREGEIVWINCSIAAFPTAPFSC